MPEKRSLEFDQFSKVVAELENLISGGYEIAGQWNFAQTCEHLNHWLSFPMDGFPKTGIVMSTMLGLMRITVGQKQLRSILADGFKNGVPTIPETVAEPDVCSDQVARNKLTETIQRFESHQGPLFPSPLFGEMDKATLTRLQLRHFEHHLGFLVPRQN